MGLINLIKGWIRDDWCTVCRIDRTEIEEGLYLLPMTVGHYTSHKKADYYGQNLLPIGSPDDIPTARYACRLTKTRCPKCAQTVYKLVIFLKVRDSEKLEDFLRFSEEEAIEAGIKMHT